MGLQEEIDRKISEIRSDGYFMSIGELINIYRDWELEIHPEFQRFFRWNNSQKARFIESILLGIPLPSIFVFQRQDGIWDLVDGLQRLSTIFEFVGVLKNESGELVKPLTLEGTKYLPSLQGKNWNEEEDIKNSLTPAQRLFVKRAKFDVKILVKESDEKSKYELFQRLNTGGSSLSDQEIRNCTLVMENKNIYRWLRDLASHEKFQECVALTDRSLEQQYDMELVLRFIILRKVDTEELTKVRDFSEFLHDKALQIAADSKFEPEGEGIAFRKTFEILHGQTKENSFRRYDPQKDRFSGGFLISAFEVIALGIGYNYEQILSHNDLKIKSVIKKWWTDQSDRKKLADSSTSVRMRTTIPIGRKIFQEIS